MLVTSSKHYNQKSMHLIRREMDGVASCASTIEKAYENASKWQTGQLSILSRLKKMTSAI